MRFINWIRNKGRLRNKAMWVAFGAQAVIAAQLLGALFGYDLSADLSNKITLAYNAVLIVLSTLGIFSNPAKPDSEGFNL